MSVNILVVPALRAPQEYAGQQAAALATLEEELRSAGMGVMHFDNLPEYDEAALAADPALAIQVSNYASRQRETLVAADALVVVNNIPEDVSLVPQGTQASPDAQMTPELTDEPGGDPTKCWVLHSVGRLAVNLLHKGVQAYGPRSDRLFLSHELPNADESLHASGARSWQAAEMRRRIMEIETIQPAALQGDYQSLLGVTRWVLWKNE